ncbi:MAG: DUF4230 domain-containing protein [Bacteroidota bacterium]
MSEGSGSPFRNIIKLVLFIGVFVVATLFLLRGFGGEGFGSLNIGSSGRNYTNVPEEFQLTYKPVNFTGAVDMENAIAILSYPERYQREFDQLVYEFNMSLIDHTTARMGLPDSTRMAARLEYEKHHPDIQSMYYRDFVALQDSTQRGYKSWYGTEITDAVEAMEEVSSKYTCFMLNLVLAGVLETYGGSLAGKGNKVETPCGVAITEGLRPTIRRMQEMAAVEDFTRAKGLIHQRVENSIAELATREIEDVKALSRSLQTKIWGYAVSETEIEISAKSFIKVGFDLNKVFELEVDKAGKFVNVTLPEPEILSLEVLPRYDKLSVGWWSKIRPDDLNRDLELLSQAFREDAYKSNVFDNAKQEAAQLMNTMLGPLVGSLGSGYRLRVDFRPIATADDTNTIGEQQFGQLLMTN